MKYLTILVLFVGILMCSCNKNDEPPVETVLSVSESYLPCTVSFYTNDTEWMEKIKGWWNKEIIVNDLSELPDDPLGFSDAYKSVDFDEYTLLITYNIHNWQIETYRNRYYLDNIDKIYNWTICVGTSTIPDDNAEPLYFTRYAILVKKLPPDAKINIWFSMGAVNWDSNKRGSA